MGQKCAVLQGYAGETKNLTHSSYSQAPLVWSVVCLPAVVLAVRVPSRMPAGQSGWQ